MKRHVLLATEKAFSTVAREQTLQVLKDAGYEVTILENYKDKADILKVAADADAMIVRSDKIDEAVLNVARKLKLIVRAGAGYDNVDCDCAASKNVAVMNTPGQNSNGVAELALGLMIYVARCQFNGKSGTELKDKTLGVHAIGAVGSRVAKIAAGFGMKVLAFDAYLSPEQIVAAGAEPVFSVEELYRRSDYVSLHIPATAQTKCSIGRNLISLMPIGGCLVNTARAEVINEPELVEILKERADLKYVSDIAPSEAIQLTLKDVAGNRVYWTPKKMGAQTEEANTNAGIAAARQIVGFFEKNDGRYIVNKVPCPCSL